MEPDKGLASKVKDIEGKKLKSILKKPTNVNEGKAEGHSEADNSRYKINFDSSGVPVFNFNSSCVDSGAGGEVRVSQMYGETRESGDNEGGVHEVMHGSTSAPHSYAQAASKGEEGKPVSFRHLLNDEKVDGSDVVIPLSSVKKVSSKFDNTLYGYFIGKRLAYPIVEKFVKNSWRKYGFTRSMMNGKGFFFFQFDSKVGMERVLEDGPWMIRNIPIILNTWTPSVSLSKEGINVVPVWVKLHDVPLVAFTEDGLSLLATKLGKPKRLDGYTSDMCRDLWGRSSFARALIEVSSEKELLEEIIVAIPSVEGEGYVKEKITVEYDWKPPRCGLCCIFGHSDSSCVKNIADQKVEKGKDKVADDGFEMVTGKGKYQAGKSGKFAKGMPIKQNPKLIYRPVSHPMELPAYRKKAADWSRNKARTEANNRKVGGNTPVAVDNNKNRDGLGPNGGAVGAGQNSFEVLNQDVPDDSVEENELGGSSEFNSEGESTPSLSGLNG